MREIKFRAWDGKVMNHKINMMTNFGAIKEGFGATAWIQEAKAGIPMQYTGLKDKNGKEIFEGDIVHFRKYNEKHDELDQGIGVVEFCKRDFLYYLQLSQCKQTKPKPSGFFRGLGDLGLCEVIGNIHENPELLEAKCGI